MTETAGIFSKEQNMSDCVKSKLSRSLEDYERILAELRNTVTSSSSPSISTPSPTPSPLPNSKQPIADGDVDPIDARENSAPTSVKPVFKLSQASSRGSGTVETIPSVPRDSIGLELLVLGHGARLRGPGKRRRGGS